MQIEVVDDHSTEDPGRFVEQISAGRAVVFRQPSQRWRGRQLHDVRGPIARSVGAHTPQRRRRPPGFLPSVRRTDRNLSGGSPGGGPDVHGGLLRASGRPHSTAGCNRRLPPRCCIHDRERNTRSWPHPSGSPAGLRGGRRISPGAPAYQRLGRGCDLGLSAGSPGWTSHLRCTEPTRTRIPTGCTVRRPTSTNASVPLTASPSTSSPNAETQ